MTRYCNLARAKQENKKGTTSDTIGDAIMMDNILAASKRIDKVLQPSRWAKRPFFAPYIESRVVTIRDYRVNSLNQTFDMEMWLFAFTAVLAGAQNVTSKLRGYLPSQPPFDKLQINDNSCDSWYTLETSPTIRRPYPEPLTITGTWGWSDDWTNGFVNTATLNGNVLVGDLTIAVQAGEGALFSPGDFILINAEYLEVTSISTDTLTVSRAQNGSTATAHTSADDVSIWQIPEDIQRITARQASHMYARRGAYDVQEITELGTIQYPQDLLVELRNTTDAYRSM
jgi:hypothetical protein